MGIHASQKHHHSAAAAVPIGKELKESLPKDLEFGLAEIRQPNRSFQGDIPPVFIGVVQIVAKPPHRFGDVKEFAPQEAQPKVVVECVVWIVFSLLLTTQQNTICRAFERRLVYLFIFEFLLKFFQRFRNQLGGFLDCQASGSVNLFEDGISIHNGHFHQLL